MRPNVEVSAAGIERISSSSTTFVKPLAFSNGIAELTLKKPPPLVPSSLIDSCEATGPSAIRPCSPSTVVKAFEAESDCTTPWETSTSAAKNAIGNST